MFVRDPWTAGLMPNPNSWLGEAPGWGQTPQEVIDARDQVLLRQLHGWALAIYQAQQDILAAQARGDAAYVQARLQDLQRLRGLFEQTAREYQGNDPLVLGGIDQFILSAGTWIEQSVRALPGAIAAVPNAILEAIGKIAGKAGSVTFGALLPWLAVGGLVYFAVKQAERTRTYRRVVA